ncbi:hypothetical protein Q3G72_031618 [Acer saccharum]|nr:hypothetical protein Q3G72_031618 [Acer saccharum]
MLSLLTTFTALAENWLNHGGDLYNRRCKQGDQNQPKTVSKLGLKWEFYAGKDISATPSIFIGTLYFPSWNGEIYAVNASDGSLVWKKDISNLTGLSPRPSLVANVNWTVSRATPTIVVDHDLLIIGVYGPAFVVAVRRSIGELVWSTQLDQNPAAVITVSDTYYKVFCKLDIESGEILWKTFTLPDNFGKTGAYAGAAIWGSSPSIDIHRNHVYIAAGNLYSVPPHIEECQERENNQTVPTHLDRCVELDNHSNSILALDLDSGKIKWYHQLGGYDLWFFACNNLSTPGCPPGPNPDGDFGEAPMMFSIQVKGIKKDIVAAVQKSSTHGKGPIYAMNAKTGKVLWSYNTGGTVYGGMSVITKQAAQNWPNHGGDLYNRRYANKEKKISPETVSKLHLKWKFYTGGDISVTPAIFNDTIYFPSWNGNIYAVKASDGSLVWKKNLQKLTGFNNTGFVLNVNSTVSRSTPTIAGDLLLVGLFGPAVVIAVKKSNGNLVWSTRLDDHARGFITMSGTYYKEAFYVGTSSIEEGLSVELCCTFRGSLAKLEAKTGKILWQTFMLPDDFGKTGEYAGAAIWESSPSIDSVRNNVYIATGNLYSAPLHIQQCQKEENNQTAPTSPDKCIEPENHSNSILALDLDTGKIKWYKQLGGYDVWFGACNWHLNPNCPPGPSPDADFAEAPMMLSIYVNRVKHDIVVAVQKSGFAWALDHDNSSLVWSMVERERGITVKAQPATMFYKHKFNAPGINEDNESSSVLINLIDTPGHVDFSYEVSRSLAACQGALLVVDAAQGVQAQTVANFYLAFESNLTIIPVINKIDQPTADPDRVKAQLKSMFDL